jgi:phosphoglycerate dehydrogenase-like enzyme
MQWRTTVRWWIGKMAKPKILVLAQHAPQARRLGVLLGNQYDVKGMDSLPELGEIDADVVLATRLTAKETARLRCVLLHVPGAGLDGIPLSALPPACRVANVFGHEIPMAEYVVWAMLDHCVNTAGAPATLHAGNWAAAYHGRLMRAEASGSTVGILGFGHIGREIALRADALGIQVVAITRTGAPVGGARRTVASKDLLAVLPQLDFLVLACPLTDETRGIIGADALGLMRPGAVLINVGRAPLVDEAALFDALSERRIAAAYLDVWYQYPQSAETDLPPARHPFHKLPSVRCTPHIAGWTEQLLERRYTLIARNIAALYAGRGLENEIIRSL